MERKLNLKIVDGDEEYSLKDGEACFIEVGSSKYIQLEVGTDKAIKITNEEHDRQPNIKLFVAIEDFSIPQTDETLRIPNGYENDSYLTNFYYWEHHTIDNVLIEVLESNENSVTLKITGETDDVNHYTGNHPKAKIDLTGTFFFSNKEPKKLDFLYI